MHLVALNWQSLGIFAIILCAYFVGLGIFCLIKHLIRKKKFKKEQKEKVDEEETE